MSVHDEMTSLQRCLDDLSRSVARLEHHIGEGDLEMRRVRHDTAHLRESVALLRAAAPGTAGPQGPPSPPRAPDLVPVPDTPYDSSLWTDVDDEGLGARHGERP
jgi:hypothetical protein